MFKKVMKNINFSSLAVTKFEIEVMFTSKTIVSIELEKLEGMMSGKSEGKVIKNRYVGKFHEF